MHATKITTKEGKIYEGVVLDSGTTLLERKGKPYVRLVGDKIYEISLLDIKSAVTEKERVGIGRIEDIDELPAWLAFYNESKNLKRERT